MKPLNIIFGLIILLGPLLLNSGCHAGQLDTVQVRLAGQPFTLEIAADDESRARGLMFRTSMAADRGMLFVFEQAEPQSFWMRNTKIPLDIMYFGADGKLVSTSANTPPCRTASCPSFPSEGPARYVVELNAGSAAKLGLSKGSALCIVGGDRFGLPACQAPAAD